MFISWVVFLATDFNQIDIKPEKRILIKKMPKVFWETEHKDSGLVIDATEFKFQQASNYNLSSLMFSNYKNTMTGKALTGIAPHVTGIHFSDIYPDSISYCEIEAKVNIFDYCEINAKINIFDYVNPEREIMSDRGFAIHDLCMEIEFT